MTNPYLEQVRLEVVNPVLQLKTIKDELLCGAIMKALGRQGERVLFAIHKMKKVHTQYLQYIHGQAFDEKALQSAQHHNETRKCAIKAQCELLAHQHAVGFMVDNPHSLVHQTFPITEDPLLVKWRT